MLAFPKTKREESAAYRALARGRDCQLRVPLICSHDSSTTVLAHSNWHDKGGARKASDFWGVWACYSCHSWLDQGSAISEAKQLAFGMGLRRMKAELQKIVDNPLLRARDRDAAGWGLERLQASTGA